jgi:hypothetical protein
MNNAHNWHYNGKFKYSLDLPRNWQHDNWAAMWMRSVTIKNRTPWNERFRKQGPPKLSSILDDPKESNQRHGTGLMTTQCSHVDIFVYDRFWHFLLEDGRNVRLTRDLLDDLIDIVEDAQRRDHDMKCIAREAQLMSLLVLRQEDLLCWVAHTLVELSSMMAFVPTIDDVDLVEIPDPDLVDSSLCKCTQKKEVVGSSKDQRFR